MTIKKTIMERSKRAAAFILLMLLALAAAACDENVTVGGEESSDIPQSTEEVTTAAPESLTFDIIKDGSFTLSRIVYPSEPEAEVAPELAAAKQLRDLLNASAEALKGSELSSDEKLAAEEDLVMPGQSRDGETIEILVGATAYDESREAFDGVPYGGYAVKAVGNKIVVAAYTEQGYTEAAEALGELIKQSADNESRSVTLARSDISFTGDVLERVSAMPIYDGGSFYAYYEAGNDVDEVIINNTDLSEFDAYISKLESLGYVCYNSNEVVGNKFTTYNGDAYTINAGYYVYENAARITVEALVNDPLPNTPQEYTKVTTTQLTLLGLEYKSGDSYKSNGLSMLIRLEDGRFIVIDGGFTRQACGELLRAELLEQSREYAKNYKDITIAAWIVTHAHGDHMGMIGKYYGLFEKYKVENFIVNFMSDNERFGAMAAYSSNWSEGEGGGYANVLTAAEKLGANVHIAHVGEIFCFADVKIEMLYTIESFGPRACNALNTTSLVFKLTCEDTSVLITGDATGNALQIATKTFGSYLKSDILQVSHHGYTTWGNDAGTTLMYKAVKPTTLLWPQGGHGYPKYVDKSYNAVLMNSRTNPNYAETYVAGYHGDTATLPLPYTVGTAIVNRVAASNVEGGNKIITGK